MEGLYADSLQRSPLSGDLESLFQPGLDEDGFKSRYDWQTKLDLGPELGISQSYDGEYFMPYCKICPNLNVVKCQCS